jgi:hypothetical protein
MNPTDSSRPSREAEWIRSQYKEMRSKLTLVREKIKRSGNQENENKYDEWVKFCEGSDVIAYAKSVLSDDIMDQFGKALPGENQSDTCMFITTTGESPSSISASCLCAKASSPS